MDIYFQLNSIQQAAQQTWEEFKNYKVWVFHGAMGSGKTTFIHALCEVLLVKNAITSPTFAIINEYTSDIAGTIYHMDWYRLKDEEEAIRAGIEDCLLSGYLCFIEWPEKAQGLLPENTLHLFIEITDKETRTLRASF